ncbi:outer membrane beta-barrel protein (plasmid) [Acetobacter sp. AC2005]|uniref:outer membrane beta-barrel protein n=1 Tax=Acetobacter sp. AC2005 TaxID=3134142 RepID=UPI0030CFBC6A
MICASVKRSLFIRISSILTLRKFSSKSHSFYGGITGDRANQAQLDQLTLTAARAVDTTASSYDVGFMVRGLYGAEGRYFDIAGITDRLMTSRYQFIVPQAHLDVHLPWLTPHGLDMQAGILALPYGRGIP